MLNSRNRNSWDEIRNLLDTHFGEKSNVYVLFADIGRLKQLPNEKPLTFVSRLQSHYTKMYAAINKQELTTDPKQAQTNLVEKMILTTVLTELELNLAQIIRVNNPPNVLFAITKIKRKFQFNHFESQKFSNPVSSQNQNLSPSQIRKPRKNQKICNLDIWNWTSTT